MEPSRSRPFSPKFIVVLISMVLVGYYVMNRTHKGKSVLPVMPGSKSARIAEPEIAETPPAAQPAERELMMSSSKSMAVFHPEGTPENNQQQNASITTQPAAKP